MSLKRTATQTFESDLLTLHARRTPTDWIAQRSDSQIRYQRWRGNRLVETRLEPMHQRYRAKKSSPGR